MKINNRHLILSLIMLLILIVPVFALNVLDEFNEGFQKGLQKISNKFYSKETNVQNLVTGKNILNNCPDSQTLFKLSSSTNAHAALFSDTAYTFRACTNGLIIVDRTCDADNSDVIIKLSSVTNAHVEKPTGTGNYAQKVCSSDLTCNYRLGNCNADEQCVVSISGDTNAHVGDCISGYNTKLCCKNYRSEPTLCSINSCQNNVCNSQSACTSNECNWDSTNNKCCSPGKKWDSISNKCEYGLITVTLNSGSSSKFIWNNQVLTLRLNNVPDQNTVSITVSSTTSNLAKNNFLDIDLSSPADTIKDMRIRLDSTSGSQATLTYLLSDTGVCTSTICNTNSFCSNGLDQCTFGTTCTFWPPNTRPPGAGCCPSGKRWDSSVGACGDFRSPNACSSFGSTNPGTVPLEVCCQASSSSGFYLQTTVY